MHILDRLRALWLLLELNHLRPYVPVVSEEFIGMLRRSGWRPFIAERVTR